MLCSHTHVVQEAYVAHSCLCLYAPYATFSACHAIQIKKKTIKKGDHCLKKGKIGF